MSVSSAEVEISYSVHKKQTHFKKTAFKTYCNLNLETQIDKVHYTNTKSAFLFLILNILVGLEVDILV